MKRLSAIILTLAAFVAVSCSEAEVDNTPSSLEVEFTPGWDATRGLTRSSQTASVAVKLNVETVNWRVSSDSEWCVVDEEAIHTGSGEFEITILGNDTFDKRHATVSVKAGAYTRQLQVDQTGNVFILNSVYAAFPAKGTQTVEVEVKARTAWEVADSEWIHAEKIGSPTTSADGMTTTRLSISCDENAGAAYRYGSFELQPEDGYALEYSVFQFGTELAVNDENKFEIAGAGDVSFDIVAPADAVAKVVAPDWVTYASAPGEDEALTTYTFTVGKNLNDTKSGREGVIALEIKDCPETVELPAISQGFIPAGGLVTGKGLQVFAAAYNAGESIEDWVSNESGSPVINIVGDISMSEVTEWVPIGTASRPFSGVIAGNSHKLTGWTSTAPLFGVTAADAQISDLTIDADCRFLVTGSITAETYLGAFVGTHKGTLTNCVNRAAITADKLTVGKMLGVGGIAGCIDGGKLTACSNEATLTLTNEVAIPNKHIYVGGVAGISKSASDEVKGSSNKGVINVAVVQTDRASNPAVYLGGIVGSVAGTVSDCSTTERGISVKSDAIYILYCGGIAGYSTGAIEGCTNKLTLTTTLDRNGDNCRYEYTGGIVGRFKGSDGIEVKNNSNSGPIVSASTLKLLYTGGVAGYLDQGNIVASTNSAKIDIKGDATSTLLGNRNVYVGGVLGVARNTVSIVGTGAAANTGAITVAALEDYSTGSIYAGGIVGWFEATGSIRNIKNTGAVTSLMQAAPAGTVGGPAVGYAIGGIAGIGNCDIEKAVNEGKIEVKHTKNAVEASSAYLGGILGWNEKTAGVNITECENKAEVSITSSVTANPKLYNTYVAGVLGYSNVEVSLSKCKNSGYIARNGINARLDLARGATAGIVGAIDGAAATVTDCHSTSDIRNYNYNNTVTVDGAPVGGGIVGIALGADAANKVEIKDCSASGAFEGKRGFVGGIAGYIQYGTIDGCRFTGTTIGAGPTYTGGVAACAEETAIAACTVKSAGLNTNLANTGNGAIAGWLKQGSSITGCKGHGVLTQSTGTTGAGMAAGISVAGTTITGCGVGGSIRGTALTAGNFSTYVCGDANAAVSGCYYWDGVSE